jgi:hypothetical protein
MGLRLQSPEANVIGMLRPEVWLPPMVGISTASFAVLSPSSDSGNEVN